MAKHYSNEDRAEALKLASEIGNKAASERLGIKLETLYVWISKDKKRTEMIQTIVQDKGPEVLVAECEALKKALHEREQEVEVLQEALSFFVKRQKK